MKGGTHGSGPTTEPDGDRGGRVRDAAEGSEGPTEGTGGAPTEEPERDAAERHTFQVEEGTGERLDRWLADRLRLSRTRVAELIQAGDVRVDGRTEKKSYEPGAGETVTVRVPLPEPTPLDPEPIPLEILHEDEALAVVDKPAGMVVHPAPGHASGTLVHALLHHLDRLSSAGGSKRPGIVHRLDKDTSGLLIVAKTDASHRKLSRALSERRIDRGYVAASWGHLDEDRRTVDAPIGRDPKNRRKQAVVEHGKPARTHVRRVERWRSADLLALKLESGRTHQIRVHLRHLGHPVVNDPLYAGRWEKGFMGEGGRWAEEFAGRCQRMFLHAARLAFRHPESGEELTFTSPVPEPLASAVVWARETS